MELSLKLTFCDTQEEDGLYNISDPNNEMIVVEENKVVVGILQ